MALTMPDFTPTPAVACSLAASVLLGLFLLALSHRPCKVAAPGRRFALAVALALVCWSGLLLLFARLDVVDLLSAACMLATAVLAGFTLWTLVAWGFTVSLLMALYRADGPLSPADWINLYTAGKTIDAFRDDRLGLLFRLQLVRRQGDHVVAESRRGRRVARVTSLLRFLFGLPS